MRIVEVGRAPRRHVLVELCKMLKQEYGALSVDEVLGLTIEGLALGRLAIVASFDAVLLKLVSEIDPKTSILFLDPGKHFRETLAYRDDLVAVRDVRSPEPEHNAIHQSVRDENVWPRNPDRCCGLRKRERVQRALVPFFVSAMSRRCGQNVFRLNLQFFEAAPPHIKLNPLAHWPREDVASYMLRHDLPVHPLVEVDFPSIGCALCAAPLLNSEGARAGRWRSVEKTECGIHLNAAPGHAGGAA